MARVREGNASTPNTGVTGVRASGRAKENKEKKPRLEQPPAPKAPKSKLKAATIDGLKAVEATSSMFVAALGRGFTKGGEFNKVKDTKGAYDRGALAVDVRAVAGGCEVTVDTFHQHEKARMHLMLQAEVLDPKTGKIGTVTLGTLAHDTVVNPKGYEGRNTFYIKYEDVDAYLKKLNKKLRITPGRTRLAVAGVWLSSAGSVQHRAGSFNRNGDFVCPRTSGITKAATAAASAVSGTSVAREAEDIPLDVSIPYSQAFQSKFATALLAGGSLTTRLESEFKGTATKKALEAAVDRMYELAEKCSKGQTAMVEAILGPDWTIEPVDRYWLKDSGGKVKRDSRGWPQMDPMRDEYMDDDKLSMTKHDGAVRVRSNEAKSGVFNVKPGGGRRDKKTGIVQRVEIGMELAAKAGAQEIRSMLTTMNGSMGDASGFRDSAFNHAYRQVEKLDEALNLAECLTPWLEIVDDRHKFKIMNKATGVEVEISFDFVETRTLRKEHEKGGKPQTAEYCQVEMELDHLQLQSKNVGSYEVPTGGVSKFDSESAQATWIKDTSKDATLDVEPMLHHLGDLDDPAFRLTSSYAAFEDVVQALNAELFPKGLEPARQKAAQAAEQMGLIKGKS